MAALLARLRQRRAFACAAHGTSLPLNQEPEAPRRAAAREAPRRHQQREEADPDPTLHMPATVAGTVVSVPKSDEAAATDAATKIAV